MGCLTNNDNLYVGILHLKWKCHYLEVHTGLHMQGKDGKMFIMLLEKGDLSVLEV